MMHRLASNKSSVQFYNNCQAKEVADRSCPYFPRSLNSVRNLQAARDAPTPSSRLGAVPPARSSDHAGRAPRRRAAPDTSSVPALPPPLPSRPARPPLIFGETQNPVSKKSEILLCDTDNADSFVRVFNYAPREIHLRIRGWSATSIMLDRNYAVTK